MLSRGPGGAGKPQDARSQPKKETSWIVYADVQKWTFLPRTGNTVPS